MADQTPQFVHCPKPGKAAREVNIGKSDNYIIAYDTVPTGHSVRSLIIITEAYPIVGHFKLLLIFKDHSNRPVDLLVTYLSG